MPTRVTYTLREIGGVSVGEFRLSSDSGVNPLSGATVAEIRARLRALDNTDPPHALIFAAEGRCFCAGADLKEFKDITVEGFRAYMTDVLSLYAEMVELRKPILALVHADARGGGAALAFCSDFAIAAGDAKFALPEVHRGLAGGGYLMPRLLGKHRATEMVMLGRSYSAEEAREMGLVAAVCPPDALEDAAAKLLAELGALAPGGLAVAKRSVAAGLSLVPGATGGMRQAMAVHVEAQTEAFVAARAQGLI